MPPPPQLEAHPELSVPARVLRSFLAANIVVTAAHIGIMGSITAWGRPAVENALGFIYAPLALLAMLSIVAVVGGIGHVLFLLSVGILRDRRLLKWGAFHVPFIVANVLMWLAR